MTTMGVIHLLSAIYLSGVLCLAVSVNENRNPFRIVRETLRRWGKFVVICLVVGFVVSMFG
jgi:hypothetical protein